jgi:tyrosyl-tRNA synthetase
MKIFIPTKVYESVIYSIEKNIDFINIKENQKSKLIKELISLWYYIYNAQKCNQNIKSLKQYVSIYNVDIIKFRIRINSKLYQHNNLLEMLSNVSLIKVNQKFSKGNFPKSYRVETDFIGLDYSEVEIDFDKVFDNIRNKSYWL